MIRKEAHKRSSLAWVLAIINKSHITSLGKKCGRRVRASTSCRGKELVKFQRPHMNTEHLGEIPGAFQSWWLAWTVVKMENIAVHVSHLWKWMWCFNASIAMVCFTCLQHGRVWRSRDGKGVSRTSAALFLFVTRRSHVRAWGKWNYHVIGHNFLTTCISS